MSAEHSERSVLRAKYLDWCSARLADRFLQLTPEQIYQISLEASPPEGDAAGSATSGTFPESYRAIVERVTGVLAVELNLPPFEDWLAAYRSDPGRFEDELLGLWKEGVHA